MSTWNELYPVSLDKLLKEVEKLAIQVKKELNTPDCSTLGIYMKKNQAKFVEM